MLLQKFKDFLASTKNSVLCRRSQRIVFFAGVSKEQYPKTDISNAHERNKTVRGLDNEDSAKTSVVGMRIYYNFTRPHQGLKGKTPAETCGITIRGNNKWITLIQNASKSF